MKTGKALWQIQAEKDFENSFENEEIEIRWDEIETHENVSAAYGGWENGTYLRENKNGTVRIMRTAPEFSADPRSENGIGLSAFLAETDENRSSVIDGETTFEGVDFNPGYGAIYSEPDESENSTNPDVFESGRSYTAETLNRELANLTHCERMISETIARCEADGIALSAEAILEIEYRCIEAQG